MKRLGELLGRLGALFRAWEDAFDASLHALAADLRMLVSAREAASVDRFNAELIAVTTSEDEREDLRRAAILIGQMGLRSEDIERIVRDHYISAYRRQEAT